jgi:hypothetical protein
MRMNMNTEVHSMNIRTGTGRNVRMNMDTEVNSTNIRTGTGAMGMPME